MNNKLISVIVTVYNREKFLRECLDSLRNQTYKNFEAIVIDDGSTDNSLNIIKAYAEIDSRFKIIASEHIGFPEAKNIGLKNAQGDYIIFLDSDDSAYPDWLKLLYDLCEQTGADISTCLYDEYIDIEGQKGKAQEPDMKAFYSNFIPISEYSFLKMNLLCQYGCTSYMWNKLIRKELYEGIHFKDQIALSDISTMYKIFDKANKVVQVHLPLIHYRRHLDSMGKISLNTLGSMDYYIFRFGILKEMTSFIWEHYPQSRRAIQIMLKKEFDLVSRRTSIDELKKAINFDDAFKPMFQCATLPYTNKM